MKNDKITGNVPTISYCVNFKTLFVSRIIMCVGCLGFIIWKSATYPLELLRYSSSWGVELITIYYCMILVSYIHGRHYDHDYEYYQLKQHPTYNRILSIVFQIAWSFGFAVYVVANVILLPVVMIEFQGNHDHRIMPYWELLYFGAEHSLPYMFMLIDIMVTSVYFEWQSLLYSIGLTIVFSIMDACIVLTGHPPAYPVVFEWNNYYTPLALAASIGVIVAGYFLGKAITKKNETKYGYMPIEDECNNKFFGCLDI